MVEQAATEPGADDEPTAVSSELTEFGTVARSQTQLVTRRFFRHRLALGALIVFLLMALAALLAPRYYAYSYDEISPQKAEAPSAKHWFGTDNIGKDMYAKVARGATKSLQVAILAAIVTTLLGVVVGALAGYYRGWLDAVLMRITDLFLVLPSLAILLVAANKFRGEKNNWLAIALVIAAFAWMYQARITRSEFLSLRERDFVKAARALGASDRRIMFRHIVPNALGSIIVNATLTIAVAVLTEATLSFLGFGVAPPDTSLGKLVSEGASVASTKWWLFYLPGLWLIVLLLCVNFIGDGLRDAFDPQQERTRE